MASFIVYFLLSIYSFINCTVVCMQKKNIVNFLKNIYQFLILQDMQHSYKFGYVSHTNQRGLYKLDLANMRYVKSIDLTPYNCVPRNMQFSALCKFNK